MKKIFSILATLLFATAAYSQKDSINAVIRVENRYNPIVTKAAKKGVIPAIEQNTAAPLKLEFSQQATPFTGFTSERDVTALHPTQEASLPFYVRGGYGTGHNTDTKITALLHPGERDEVSAIASFNGYNTQVDGIAGEWDSRMFTSHIGARYAHTFNKMVLGTAASYGSKVFNYQRWQPTDKQNVQRGNFGLFGKSILAGPLSYEFSAAFSRINYKRTPFLLNADEDIIGHIAENKISAEGLLKYEFTGELLRNAALGIEAGNYFYNGSSLFDSFFSLNLNPHANILFKGMTMRLGAQLSIITKHNAFLAIAPDLSIEGAVNKNLTLYTTIKGGRDAACVEAMEQLTPYWAANPTKAQYTIADIRTGARFSYENFSTDAFAGYSYTKDEFLQSYTVTESGVGALIAQDNVANAYIGAYTAYNYNGWIKATAAMRYNYYTCDHKPLLFMKPELELEFGAQARLLDDLYINLGYCFATYKHDTPSKNKNELNLRASYKFMDRFSAFVEGNNLLNQEYFKYAGYYEQGINMLLGLSASF